VEETISILNNKKHMLAALIHKPAKKGKFPAVILLPGFRRTKDDVLIKQLAIKLANSNIVAIRFDPSGFGESEGEIERDYRLSNYFSDTESVYDATFIAGAVMLMLSLLITVLFIVRSHYSESNSYRRFNT
jgi:dienelactone hydrolase